MVIQVTRTEQQQQQQQHQACAFTALGAWTCQRHATPLLLADWSLSRHSGRGISSERHFLLAGPFRSFIGDLSTVFFFPAGFMIVGPLSRLCKKAPRIFLAMNPQVVFVLGGPGAGKGTQCAKIVEVGRSRATSDITGLVLE